MEKIQDILAAMRYYAQGCMRFVFDDLILYTDPFHIPEVLHDADYIFISHPHFDHLSKEDLLKVCKSSTTVIAPKTIQKEMEALKLDGINGFCTKNIQYFDLEETFVCPAFSLTLKPAYNIKKTQCHPKEKRWAGALIETQGNILYYTSDTELIESMSHIACDAIFLPLGQTYTFESVKDAAEAARICKAKFAVPIHYGLYEGTMQDCEQFKTLLEGDIQVILK